MANYVQEPKDRFCYVYSYDLDIPFRIKIGTLEGQREKKSVQALLEDPKLKFSGLYQSEFSDLYVECQIFSNGKAISLPSRTSYKAFSKRWNWNEWVVLPVHYKDIPRSSVLVMTICDIYGPRKTVSVGGTTVAIFGKEGCLRCGIHDLRVWPGMEGDGSVGDLTPGESDQAGSEMMRLAKLVKKHRKGRMMAVDWLDRLTYREIEVINEQEKRSTEHLYLNVEFPKFHFDGIEHHVVYFEPDGELTETLPPHSDLVMVRDPEWNLDNLVEAKHHCLTHSLRKGMIANDLVPNARTRDHIATILNYPPNHSLTSDEKSLIWQFRYYLCHNKGALTKFLQSVDWSSKQETEEALDLLTKWQPLDPADALELLTPMFRAGVDPKVCKYAVSRLQCADNDELVLYLLQLVQALRYEQPEFLSCDKPVEGPPALTTDDTTYSEATKNRLEREIAEAAQEGGEEGKDSGKEKEEECTTDSDSDDERLENNNNGSGRSLAAAAAMGRGGQHLPSSSLGSSSGAAARYSIEASIMSMDVSACSSSSTEAVQETEFPDLASFLIARACCSMQLTNYFYWYLTVECTECRDPETRKKYKAIRTKFVEDLKQSPKPRWRKRYEMLTQQDWLVRQLQGIMRMLISHKEDRIKRMEKLRAVISNKRRLLDFDVPIHLPLNPHCKVTGLVAEEASLFKSALMPAKLCFKTMGDPSQQYWVMFKLGDDLRQDQLILQLITLMDRLLRRENLDLKLTPYNVLACSGDIGFVELVGKTHAVAQVLAKYKNIQAFFRECSPPGAPNGISPEIMDTYVKSCAGYCVITYLLSIGDRHLDNLLLSEQGHLIHVDFGYILGRDPKPFPPPMKLSKEMVEAMGGGTNSAEYQKFREYCYNAFLILRRSANLIFNLFSLMLDAGVPDIALEPDKTVQKVKEKFCLHLSEEEAIQFFQSLIDESVKALFAVFMEQIHRWAQYWRK